MVLRARSLRVSLFLWYAVRVAMAAVVCEGRAVVGLGKGVGPIREYTYPYSLTATLSRIPLVDFNCNGLGFSVKRFG